MRASLSVSVGIAWLLIAASARSHHSFAAEFDVNRPVEFTGTVTRVEWTNPHAWLFLDTEDDQGNVQSWSVELLGINALMRRGLNRNSIKPGDAIIVEGFGARDGSNTANASAVTMAQTGERLWESVAGRNN
jgi:hypothetical protein